ncbi:efflux RND transporter periplasmic adaptor subunit [bacterium]|nr:efflux RND transporter periplasmic adaptor subunit [bacterium]
MARARRRTTILTISIAVVVVAAIGGYLLSRGGWSTATEAIAAEAADSSLAAGGGPTDDVPAVPVEIASVMRRGVAAFHRAASSIEADRLVDVTCRASGRVATVAVEEGDWVEAGQVLATLENDRQRVELRRAELKLAEQVRQLERSEQMLAESLVSEQEHEAVRTAHDQAVAERDLARIALEETRVEAPFAGQITDRAVVIGQMVQATARAFTLADFAPLRVRVHLPEPVAAKVTVGETVMIETEAGSDDIAGRVERISPVVDPATGTVRVTLRLPEGAEARVGGFVKARLTTDRKHDVLAVPKLALVEEGGLRSVFVAAADTVRKVEIETGLYDETHVEVTAGLEEGWEVVTLGRGGLRTGSRIEVLEDSGLSDLAAR